MEENEEDVPDAEVNVVPEEEAQQVEEESAPVETVTMTTEDGSLITVTKNGDGTYTDSNGVRYTPNGDGSCTGSNGCIIYI